MVFGCFDVLHTGHVVFLEKAKEYGDYLIVVVGRDVNIAKIKGREPHLGENTRQRIVQNLPFVDKAVLGSEKDQYAVVRELRPDVICLGHDQETYTDKLAPILQQEGINAEIIRLPAYKRSTYSSTKIKKDLGLL